ncbi:hypothetical protein E2C01_042183 [Portunus trituberculatus]|uniref:Uncharacterized protein n=1 Tax=Portunus trituberculatus TaxID=210409 RepID=A0A5B7FL33_PORTR|nr:hypothetical protein [Portunus trituberculatus]
MAPILDGEDSLQCYKSCSQVSPFNSPLATALVRAFLGPALAVLPLLSSGRHLISPPPWKLPSPVVSFTPTTKSDLPPLQLQLALEHVMKITSFNTVHITSTMMDCYKCMVPLVMLSSHLTCRCLLEVGSVVSFMIAPALLSELNAILDAVSLIFITMTQLTTWRRKPAISPIMVMEVLFPFFFM